MRQAHCRLGRIAGAQAGVTLGFQRASNHRLSARSKKMAELNVLDNLRTASPCSAAWDQMPGDDRARFCAACGKHVYQFSAMSRAEAESLIREKEGRPCARLYRRRDGTVLTDNCPVGLRKLRRAFLLQVGVIGGVFMLIPGAAALAAKLGPDAPLWRNEPWHSVAVRLGIVRPRHPNPFAEMGDVAPLPPAVPSFPRKK
jgi:hypothetical protein